MGLPRLSESASVGNRQFYSVGKTSKMLKTGRRFKKAISNKEMLEFTIA